MDSFERYAKWLAWFHEGVIADIANCVDDLLSKGLTINHLKAIAAGSLNRDISPAKRGRMIRNRLDLDKRVVEDSIRRFRMKMKRWHLPGIPAHTARRLSHCMGRLKTWTTPQGVQWLSAHGI